MKLYRAPHRQTLVLQPAAPGPDVAPPGLHLVHTHGSEGDICGHQLHAVDGAAGRVAEYPKMFVVSEMPEVNVAFFNNVLK